ncbi:MAG: hypothetical protein HZB19_00505 [Chloroflexi bacterium]|nr:hypothetical protein [Chloroflexota bacterium]
MIEEYFLQVENVLREFPNIRSYALNKKVYNSRQGTIGGKVIFENEYSLEFVEVADTEQGIKTKYRYHYMDDAQNLIFRYDNAPHHPQIESFPHHKHLADNVQASQEPDLRIVLFEIMQYSKK